MERRTDGDFLELGQDAELNGRRLDALHIYRAGLERFGDSVALNKAAGRVATSLHWAEAESADPTHDNVGAAIEWLERAFRRDTTDMETRYYLGLAQAAAGDTRDAREHLEAAQRFAPTGRARPPAIGAAGSAGREAGRGTEPRPGADRRGLPTTHWRGPRRSRCFASESSWPARASGARIGAGSTRRAACSGSRRCGWAHPDPTFWAHLAADGNRLLTLADHYLSLGALEDAWVLLNHDYPEIAPPAAEPGVRALSLNPLDCLSTARS